MKIFLQIVTQAGSLFKVLAQSFLMNQEIERLAVYGLANDPQ